MLWRYFDLIVSILLLLAIVGSFLVVRLTFDYIFKLIEVNARIKDLEDHFKMLNDEAYIQASKSRITESWDQSRDVKDRRFDD